MVWSIRAKKYGMAWVGSTSTLLPEVSKFDDMSHKDIEFMLSLRGVELKVHNNHNIIFQEGDIIPYLFYLKSGEIHLVKKRKVKKYVVIDKLSTPCIFGEHALFNKCAPATATVASDHSEIYSIQITTLFREIQTNPIFSRRFNTSIAKLLLTKISELEEDTEKITIKREDINISSDNEDISSGSTELLKSPSVSSLNGESSEASSGSNLNSVVQPPAEKTSPPGRWNMTRPKSSVVDINQNSSNNALGSRRFSPQSTFSVGVKPSSRASDNNNISSNNNTTTITTNIITPEIVTSTSPTLIPKPPSLITVPSISKSKSSNFESVKSSPRASPLTAKSNSVHFEKLNPRKISVDRNTSINSPPLTMKDEHSTSHESESVSTVDDLNTNFPNTSSNFTLRISGGDTDFFESKEFGENDALLQILENKQNYDSEEDTPYSVDDESSRATDDFDGVFSENSSPSSTPSVTPPVTPTHRPRNSAVRLTTSGGVRRKGSSAFIHTNQINNRLSALDLPPDKSSGEVSLKQLYELNRAKSDDQLILKKNSLDYNSVQEEFKSLQLEELMGELFFRWNKESISFLLFHFSNDIEYRDPFLHNRTIGKQEFSEHAQKVFSKYPTWEWSILERYTCTPSTSIVKLNNLGSPTSRSPTLSNEGSPTISPSVSKSNSTHFTTLSVVTQRMEVAIRRGNRELIEQSNVIIHFNDSSKKVVRLELFFDTSRFKTLIEDERKSKFFSKSLADLPSVISDDGQYKPRKSGGSSQVKSRLSKKKLNSTTSTTSSSSSNISLQSYPNNTNTGSSSNNNSSNEQSSIAQRFDLPVPDKLLKEFNCQLEAGTAVKPITKLGELYILSKYLCYQISKQFGMTSKEVIPIRTIESIKYNGSNIFITRKTTSKYKFISTPQLVITFSFDEECQEAYHIISNLCSARSSETKIKSNQLFLQFDFKKLLEDIPDLEIGQTSSDKSVRIGLFDEEKESDGGLKLWSNNIAAWSVSTYPRITSELPDGKIKIKSERQGDPICDRYSIERLTDRVLIALADGCNWGPKPLAAAKIAVNIFTDYCKRNLLNMKSIHETASLFFRSLPVIQNKIVESKELTWWECGTTTLLGGCILPVVDPKYKWVFCCINVGDCKAYRISLKQNKIFDITTNSRTGKGALDAQDCGGRLGPSKDGNPDLRNLSVYFEYLDDGDFVICTTDGVYDNLDPQTLGLHPSSAGIDEFQSWNDVNNDDQDLIMKVMLAKEKYTLDLLSNILNGIIKEKSLKSYSDLCPEWIVDALITHCNTTTLKIRQYMENNPSKPQPKDYSEYPGKVDHTTCLVVRATTVELKEDEEELDNLIMRLSSSGFIKSEQPFLGGDLLTQLENDPKLVGLTRSHLIKTAQSLLNFHYITPVSQVGFLESFMTNITYKSKTNKPELTRFDWQSFIESTTRKNYKKGDVIIKQGSTSTNIYQVALGRCSIVKANLKDVDSKPLGKFQVRKGSVVAYLNSPDFFWRILSVWV
eukprot:TRINITY_DN4439_c0_g1_i2.p1 TRINITY_DN4439_c0_g1~~TRINITY_DN4439_c0_g1_i2.p1  ORF type:complete len:1494 (-),score=306.43 TRINITY_DN4439_c0_g1_i2:277-4758(-)